MLTVADAIAAILAETGPSAPITLPLEQVLGMVLAEDVVSDLDSPPFDKSLMDGYAVRSADVEHGTARLRVIEQVLAGRTPQRTVGPGEAIQIMTGAMLPEGADAVIQVEQTRPAPDAPAGDGSIMIETTPVKPGRSILRRGSSVQVGQRLLAAGRILRPQELGLLAELGRSQVAVFPRPRVAVLATGDELVEVGTQPGPGQIRNSNETMLVAQLRHAGAVPVPLGIARDERPHLRERILKGLECDLLLLSGGVSAGEADLVPSELAAAGVRQVFHKVRVKPGQPIWFGMAGGTGGPVGRERSKAASPSATHVCHVFGLPGNPVSSMVCFELFARTAIRRLMGLEPAEPQPVRARLAEACQPGDRPTYHPARFELTADGPEVRIVKWIGSADLAATVEANAMLLIPPGQQVIPAGDIMDVFLW